MGPPSFFFSPPALPAAWAPRSPPCWSSWRSSVRHRTRPMPTNNGQRRRDRDPAGRGAAAGRSLDAEADRARALARAAARRLLRAEAGRATQAAAPSQAATTTKAAGGTPGDAEGHAVAEFRQRRRRPAGRRGFPADAGRRVGRQAALSSSADATRLPAARRRAQPAGRSSGARAPRSGGHGRRDRAAPAERLPDARSRRHRGGARAGISCRPRAMAGRSRPGSRSPCVFICV